MSSVEPSTEQIALLKADGKLEAAFRWAKVSDVVSTAIIDVMGCEAGEDMSTAAAVTTEEVETMMTAVSVVVDQVGRPLTIAEKARLRIAFTACRITCGIQTPSEVQRQWADKAAAASSGAPPATAATTNTIALTDVVAQGAKGEVKTMSVTEFNAYDAAFITKFGKPPLDPQRVTIEQLTALRTQHDEYDTLFCDFGVWLPYGDRQAKRAHFTGKRMDARGQWLNVELYGPPSYGEWEASYLVFRTGALKLDYMYSVTIEA